VPAEPSMDALVGSVLEGAYGSASRASSAKAAWARCTRRCSFALNKRVAIQADGARSGRQSRSAGALHRRGRKISHTLATPTW